MYYSNKFYTEIDIYCYMVFKKRKFKILNKILGRKTVRRGHHYWPSEGKLEQRKDFSVFDFKITNGIFSYVSWCPIDDPECDVWLCKIPKGSLVFKNSFEYVSNNLEFVSKSTC